MGVLGAAACSPQEPQEPLTLETESRGPRTSSASLDPLAPELVHRYSFTADGSDSMGGASATLSGGAQVSNGQVTLDGIDDYVNLPITNTLANLQDATFEAWVTWDASSGQTWARIFDFNDGVWSKTMFLTPKNGRYDSGPATDTPRFVITTQAMSGEEQATSANPFPVGALTHVAVTMDSVAKVNRLYVNGVQVAQKQSTALTPASLGTLQNAWLGRSLYTADPYFKGAFSEFRIYRTALSASRIAADFSAGPDTVN